MRAAGRRSDRSYGFLIGNQVGLFLLMHVCNFEVTVEEETGCASVPWGGRQRACVRAGPLVFYTAEPVHDGAEQMMKSDNALLNVCRTCARLACWRVAFVLVSTVSVKRMHGRVACGKWLLPKCTPCQQVVA